MDQFPGEWRYQRTDLPPKRCQQVATGDYRGTAGDDVIDNHNGIRRRSRARPHREAPTGIAHPSCQTQTYLISGTTPDEWLMEVLSISAHTCHCLAHCVSQRRSASSQLGSAGRWHRDHVEEAPHTNRFRIQSCKRRQHLRLSPRISTFLPRDNGLGGRCGVRSKGKCTFRRKLNETGCDHCRLQPRNL